MTAPPAAAPATLRPPLPEVARVFLRIGVIGVGGPAAQIALIHREVVEARPWLSEAEFLRALSFCMLLPGPEAMQLATYAGWRVGGVAGGLVSGGLFVLPGAVLILVLALAYGAVIDLPLVQAMFLGIKAAVVVIVAEALRRLAARALVTPALRIAALLAFLALFALAVPFPAVVAAAALWGAWTARGPAPAPAAPAPLRPGRLLGTVALGLALWWAPVAWAALAGQDLLAELGRFFSWLAVVTFGGAYAVLAYMAQEVVANRGWVTTAQLMDALGLAETTPGPLILVTAFVGALAGLSQGGPGLGLLAGLMVLWVTFVPCFLWIFAGAPLVDRLDGRPRLRGALSGITAAAAGAIASLSLAFALGVAFGRLEVLAAGPLRLPLPDPASVQPLALLLGLVAAWLILRRRLSLPLALGLVAALAGLLHLAGRG